MSNVRSLAIILIEFFDPDSRYPTISLCQLCSLRNIFIFGAEDEVEEEEKDEADTAKLMSQREKKEEEKKASDRKADTWKKYKKSVVINTELDAGDWSKMAARDEKRQFACKVSLSIFSQTKRCFKLDGIWKLEKW